MKINRVISTLALLALTPAGAVEGQLSQGLGEIIDDLTWRSIGPVNTSGRVSDVEGLPHPSKTFYVATAGGGVWKTTNNGNSFRLVWDNPRVVATGDVAISPSDPNQVWVGTGEEDSRNSISPGGGIFKSTDGGETWELKGLEETQVIGRIRVHPTNPDIVFVAALGHVWDSNPERGLYRTTDGGETWELVKFISDEAGFVDVILHPRDPDILFAASWERVRGPYFLQSGGPGSALWKSEDGGDTWTEIVGDGFPTAEKGRIGLDISLAYPKVMYAMVEAKKEEDGTGGSGLYRTGDGGETWEHMNEVNTRPFYYSQVRVDPEDPDRVYFSSTPVQFSTDGGKTYGTTTNGIHVDHHAMWIDPEDPDRIMVGNDGGVSITFDRGGNWITLNHLPISQFYHVSYNMDVPYRVCGGLQDNGLWCGPSRLSSGNMARQHLATGERITLQKPTWETGWREKQDSIIVMLERGVDEDDPAIVALREAASADSIANDLRWNWNTPFFQSVHDRSWFYTAANRVMKSTDWGDDMAAISADLSYADPEKIDMSLNKTGGVTPDLTGAETYATIVSLAESPLEAGHLFAGTDDGRVWTTTTDGDDWTEVTDAVVAAGVPPGGYVSRVTPSSHAADRFYVTVDHHRTNDFNPYVVVTDDGGRTFRSIASNLPTGSVDFVHVITEDPRNENLLFVGTDVGAYTSADRGGSWERLMNGIGHAVPVHDLKIHPRDRELIAATHGRSLWIMNIAPLQDLTSAVLAAGAAFFQPAPAFQFGQRVKGGESYGQAWFQRPTPGSAATLAYYLDDDTFRAVRQVAWDRQGDEPRRPRPQIKIEIANEAGDVVRTLTANAASGLNYISWDLRSERPDADELSPSRRVERERLMARAQVVRDSLGEEEGWEAATVERLTGLFTGETDAMQMFQAFMGGGGGGGDPERFTPRPGESAGGGMGGGGFGGFSEMQTIAELMSPGEGLRSLFRFFQGGGLQAELVEPGTYTLTMTAEDRAFDPVQIEVGRVGEYEGRNAPFQAEVRKALRGTSR